MTDFTIDWGPVDGVPSAVEVAAHGQVNTGNVKRFIEVLDAALSGRVSTLLLDAEGIPFISSTALSYLADLIWRLEARGGAVAFVRVHPKLRIVLQSLNLVQFFKFFDDSVSARAFAKELAARLLKQPRMAVTKGPGEGASYPIAAAAITIGSEPGSTICVSSAKISGKHAEIAKSPAGFVVRDLGSKTGTVLDGKRLTGEGRLAPGSIVRIGDLELRFEAP